METYSQYIELITAYINDQLKPEDRMAFEVRLASDTEFNAVYQEHLIFLNGIKRTALKSEISSAKRAYQTTKWVKISGVVVLTIGVIITLFTLINQKSAIPPNENKIESTIENDTIKAQDSTKTSLSNQDVNNKELIETSFKTTTTIAKYGSVNNTEEHIRKKAQQFIFLQNSDTILRCKEGTIIKLGKGSFIDSATNTPVEGAVELLVTEYYTLSDILVSNLSTVSNNKLLETGGMLHIEALQGSNSLELKSGSSIEISFPTASLKESMQLFEGAWDDENINWTLPNDKLESIEISDVEPIVEVPFNIVEIVPTFPECDHLQGEARKQCTQDYISRFIGRNFNTSVGVNEGLSGLHRINAVFKVDIDGSIVFIQSNAQYQSLSEEANRVIETLPQMIPGRQRGRAVIVPYSIPIQISFESSNSNNFDSRNIDFTTDSIFSGRIREVIMDTVYTESRGIVELIREVMHDANFKVDSTFIEQWDQYKKQRLIREIDAMNNRRFILKKPLFEMENTRFVILNDDSITRGGHVVRVPWDETKIPTTTRIMQLRPRPLFAAGTDTVTASEFESRVSDGIDDSISTDDVNYYVLKSSNLGWINCDRFINRRTKRFKYKIKIKNTEDTKISMVFKSFNAVLPSWQRQGYHDFQMVPENEKVMIIAIKRKNGKLYYDQIETNTSISPDFNFNLKEITLSELKQLIEFQSQ